MQQQEYLLFEVNDDIIDVITKAKKLKQNDPQLSTYEIQAESEKSEKKQKVPYPVLKQAISIVNSSNKKDDKKVWLHKLIKGSSPSFPEPPAPPPKSRAYLATLKKAQKAYEDMIYADMVRNVNFRQEKEAARDPFSNYKGQVGIGLDVVVTIFTLFCVFYFACAAVVPDPSYGTRLTFGLFGGMLGLIVDGVLMIIRGDRAEKLSTRKQKSRSAATNARVGQTRVPAKKPAEALTK